MSWLVWRIRWTIAQALLGCAVVFGVLVAVQVVVFVAVAWMLPRSVIDPGPDPDGWNHW